MCPELDCARAPRGCLGKIEITEKEEVREAPSSGHSLGPADCAIHACAYSCGGKVTGRRSILQTKDQGPAVVSGLVHGHTQCVARSGSTPRALGGCSLRKLAHVV